MSITRETKFLAPTRDTHANWTTSNPVVPEGVLGLTKGRLSTNSQEFFVGDGTKNYAALVHDLNESRSIVPPYDANVDYVPGMLASSSGAIYLCTAPNGPSTSVAAVTDTAKWAKVILTPATTSADGLMSATDKSKLNGIATGAEVNQNAFSNITVGNSTIQADGKTDTLTLAAGTGITLTADTTNDKVTIAGSTFVKSGSTAAAGLVPKPSTTAGTTKYLREDGTWQVPPDNNTTYNNATTSAAGLMSAEDKTKLDGIAAGATNVNESLYVPKVSSGGNVIKGDTNERILTFLSGTSANSSYGAKLSLGGADSTYAGQFIIQAGNASGYKQLIGKPDGTFTWDGTNIIYTHPTTNGNKHIPSGGSAGNILKYSAAGTAAWSSLSDAGIAPKPITSSGVGQVVTWGTSYSSDTSNYTLPSGGTWLVWAFSRSQTQSKNDSFSHAGIYAGGTAITHWSNTYTCGMAWRIA